MSITIKMNQDNTGIQMSGTTAGRNKTQDTKTRSTVFAGDLMLGQGNQIEQKKQTARRQAMKLITDAWGRDELASQSIKDMEQHSGYWETFIWEEGTGLIFYQRGYRDGVDFIRLKKKGVKLPSDVWYD